MLYANAGNSVMLCKVNKNIDKKRAINELKMFCKYCDVNYNTLMLKAKLYSKRWW